MLATLAVLLLGCDSSSPTTPFAGPSPSAGNWQGTTEQGKLLSFSVGGSAQAPLVTSYEVTVQIDELTPGTGCLGSEVGVSAMPVSVPIVNGGFAVDIGGLNGTTIRFEGVFESTTSASGLLTAETPSTALCAGRGVTRWTAERI